MITAATATGGIPGKPGSALGGSSIGFIEVRKGELPEGLDQFAFSNGDPNFTPFQWNGWLEAWHLEIGSQLGSAPMTVIGYYGNQPAFTLPLTVEKRYGARCLTWCGYQQSDYCAPILNVAHSSIIVALDGESVLRQIAKQIGGIDLVYTPKQPRSIGGVKNPFVLPCSVPHHAGAHAINFRFDGDWNADYRERRSSATRRRLRQKRAALEKLGAVSFRVATTKTEALELVDACLKAKSEQLLKLGHWDPFSPPGVRRFLCQYFSSNVMSSTWVVALEIDERPAAITFGFRSNTDWLLYQIAMIGGPEQRHSPGTHLLLELMAYCTRLGVRRLDLALGDESYKSEWCDEHIELRTSTLALTARGLLLRRMILLRASLRSSMASHAVLYERAKWVKGVAKKFKLPF